MTMRFTGEGTYDDDNLRIDVLAHATDEGEEADASGTLVGVRTGRCR